MSSPEAQCWFLGLSVIKNYSCTCRGSQAWCCRFMPVLLVTPMSSMCCSILIGIQKIRQQFPLTKSFRKTDKKYLFLCLRRLFYFLPVSPNPQSYFISEREVDIYIFFRRLCNTRERSWTQPRLMIFSPKTSVLPFPRWTNSAKQRSALQCLYSGLLNFKTLITREDVTPAWGIFPKEQEGCPETLGKSYFIWS